MKKTILSLLLSLCCLCIAKSASASDLFSLQQGDFNPNIWETGQYTYDTNTGVGTFYAGQYGFGGWKSDAGFDVSEYESITVTFAEAPGGGAAFRLFSVNDYWGTPASDIACSGKTSVTADISNIDRLYFVGFWSYGNAKNADGTINYVNNPIKIKSITLNKSDKYLEFTTSEAKANVWDTQVRYDLPTPLNSAHTYDITVNVKATAGFEFQICPIDTKSTNVDQWGGSKDIEYLDCNASTSWTEITKSTGQHFPYNRIEFRIGKLGGTFSITSLTIVDKTTGAVVLSDDMSTSDRWSTVGSVTQPTITDGSIRDDLSHFKWTGYDDNPDYTLKPLHQEGKNFVNSDGQAVTLHGVMETPNEYFNNHRWRLDGGYGTDNSVKNCLAYFEKLFSAYVDNDAGSYCDLFRLHLDPAWTNDPSKTATAGGGENDISRFSADRLRTYMDKLYWPIIEMAMAKGLYIIVRPPGVCPQTINVGGAYQNYLMTVWDIVSSDARIKKFAGQIMIELANEPITVLDASGKNSANALHDFFQPIVNKIRQNGFKGIVLPGGTGYQRYYQGYSQYPITGDNIGYAVHFYPGWMGTEDYKNYTSQDIINQFGTDVPVVNSRPIVITEIDWSPKVGTGTGGTNNDNSEKSENYGTWATARTSKFGVAYKAVHDHYGNISMTLTHPTDFFDFNRLFDEDYVTYAFQNKPEPKEACAYTCFQWYREWAKDHWMPGKKPSKVEKPNTLYSSMFYKWDSPLAGASKTNENTGCAYMLNSPSQMIYGTSTVDPYCYADLTGIDKLYLTVTEGEPRLLFNRIETTGDVPIETPRDAAYQKVVDNNDGTKTYIIDIKKIATIVGYAHLNAIKGANFADVIVTHITFDYDVPDYLAEPFSYDTFATTSATYDREEVSLTGGSGGWTFTGNVDLSQFKYLVVTSAQDRNMCNGSVWVKVTDGSNHTIEGNVAGSENYTTNGKAFWLDRWNNNNAVIIDLAKLKNGDFDISALKSLQFGFQNPDKFLLGMVCATNTLPTYDGDYKKSVATPERFGTICLPYAAVCSDASVYEIAGKKGNMVYARRVNFMEAGKPYIYYSTKNYASNNNGHNVRFYRVSKTANDKESPILNNGLVGTFSDIYAPQNQNCFVFSNNELYYVNSDVKIAANRAYLNLTEVPAITSTAKLIALSLVGDEIVGIESADADSDIIPVAFYTLSGTKIDKPQRGVNIMKMSNNTYRKVMIK